MKSEKIYLSVLQVYMCMNVKKLIHAPRKCLCFISETQNDFINMNISTNDICIVTM